MHFWGFFLRTQQKAIQTELKLPEFFQGSAQISFTHFNPCNSVVLPSYQI